MSEYDLPPRLGDCVDSATSASEKVARALSRQRTSVPYIDISAIDRSTKQIGETVLVTRRRRSDSSEAVGPQRTMFSCR